MCMGLGLPVCGHLLQWLQPLPAPLEMGVMTVRKPPNTGCCHQSPSTGVGCWPQDPGVQARAAPGETRCLLVDSHLWGHQVYEAFFPL